jgi:hypothetical protein
VSPPVPGRNNKILWVSKVPDLTRSNLEISARRLVGGQEVGPVVRRTSCRRTGTVWSRHAAGRLLAVHAPVVRSSGRGRAGLRSEQRLSRSQVHRAVSLRNSAWRLTNGWPACSGSAASREARLRVRRPGHPRAHPDQHNPRDLVAGQAAVSSEESRIRLLGTSDGCQSRRRRSLLARRVPGCSPGLPDACGLPRSVVGVSRLMRSPGARVMAGSASRRV